MCFYRTFYIFILLISIIGCKKKNCQTFKLKKNDKPYYIEQPCKSIWVNNACFIFDKKSPYEIKGQKYYYCLMEGEKYSYMVLYPEKLKLPKKNLNYMVLLGCQDNMTNGKPIENIEIYEVLDVKQVIGNVSDVLLRE